MGTGPLDGLNAAQLQRVAQLKAEGMSEKDAVKQVKDEQLFNYDGGAPEDRFGGELKEATVTAKAKRKAPTIAQVGIGAAVVIGASTLVGAAIGAFAGGVGAAPGAVAGAKVGTAAAVALGLLSSCVEVDSYAVGTAKSDISELVNALRDLTNAVRENGGKLDKLNSTTSQILDAIKTMISEQMAQGKTLTEILKELKGQRVDISTIVTVLKDMGQPLDEIVKALKESNENERTIIGLLTEQGSDLKAILAAMDKLGVKIDNVANNVANGNEGIKKLVVQVLNAVNQGNALDAEGNRILGLILKAIGDLSAKGDANSKKVLGLLEQILAMVTKDVEQDGKIADEQKVALDAILKAINDGNKISEDNNRILVAIYEKINSLGEGQEKANDILNRILIMVTKDVEQDGAIAKEQRAYFEAIIAKLGNMGDISLDAVIEAIDNNTKIAGNSYKVLTQILDKMDKLGDKADIIIDMMSKLAVAEVDLSKIESLLTSILNKTDENGKTLTRIEDKLDLMQAVLKQIAPTITKYGDSVKAWLQHIYNKIPEVKEHKCDHTEIIEYLKLIIEEVKKVGDARHEGILDDLDDLLG